MAIPLSSKPNTVAPGGAFPFGRIKDDTGANDGTPVDEEVYGDFHQFFASLMFAVSATYNGLRENATNGFQYLTALVNLIRLTTASETESGTAPIATQALTNAGVSDATIVTPLKLHTYLGAWITRSNVADITAVGGTGVIVTVSTIRYKIVGKTMFFNFLFQANNTTAPTAFTILIPDSKQYGSAFIFQSAIFVGDGSNLLMGSAIFNNGSPTLIQVRPVTGTLTNAATSTFSGSLTFEIA